MTIEICCDGFDKALVAQKAGADRVELCADLEIGGTTPTHETISRAIRSLDIPVNVLIRPRGGDFVFTDEEIAVMLDDIRFCGQEKANGVVIGALDKDGCIDMKASELLVRTARERGLSVTYHRAIDVSSDIFKSLEDILALKVDRVLTSGGKATAFEGLENLEKMQEIILARGSRVHLMPGSGVSASNVTEILKRTGAEEIHGSRTEIIEAARS